MNNKLISRKESKRYPGLFVKKYTRKVFYDALWNESADLTEARGHVEDAKGNVVIRPFTKIFNYQENNTDIDPQEPCVYVTKINGFMAAATYVPALDKVIVSTTGSLESDFVDYAEHYITEEVKERIRAATLDDPLTYLFEICHPSDPHIINEEFGAYLIGCRRVSDSAPYFSDVHMESALDISASVLGVRRPDWSVTRFGFIVENAKRCRHEGFVVYGQYSHTVLKIKTPYYLHLKMAARRKDIMSLDKTRIDEEYYPLVDHLTAMGDNFTSMTEQQRLDYMRSFLT